MERTETHTGAAEEPVRGERKGRVGGLSGMLASPWVILACLILMLAANLAGYALLSAVLLFFALLGLFARLWGLKSLQRVEVTASGTHPAMFAGEEVTLRYTVTNQKALPLTWLDLCQDTPLNGCMEPLDGFERYELSDMERTDGDAPRALYRKRLAFLMGWQEVSWETTWAARRRGIYQLGELLLRSGDGFGLTQTDARRTLDEPPTFVVYPKRVPVDTAPFLKNLWNGQTGSQGYVEDVTVMKTVRDYRPGDSWKRIDWRLAAREQGIQVREYETIRPRTIHFIVDGASFQNLSEGNEELEEALSILSSLLVELDLAGVRCGISLPQTGRAAAADLSPDDRSLSLPDLLFQLAGFDGDTATGMLSGALLSTLQNTVGQLCLVTHSRATLACGDLLSRLDAGRLMALPYDDRRGEGADPLAACTILPLTALKRGERHA